MIEIEDEDEPEYQVENIRQWRYNLREKQKEYFIKWLNYAEEENTWEPEAHLNCPDILQDFVDSLESDQKSLFHSRDLPKLDGIQRNAYFNMESVVGAEEVIEIGDGPSPSKKLCFLVKFEDNDTPERIDAAELFEKIPDQMMNLVEERLLARPAPAIVSPKRKHRKRIISPSSDED